MSEFTKGFEAYKAEGLEADKNITHEERDEYNYDRHDVWEHLWEVDITRYGNDVAVVRFYMGVTKYPDDICTTPTHAFLLGRFAKGATETMMSNDMNVFLTRFPSLLDVDANNGTNVSYLGFDNYDFD